MKRTSSTSSTRKASPFSIHPSGNGHGIKRKRTRDRGAKKQALILAALQLFSAKGYEVTTTREIAASAGCAEGLIHRYFKGKAGLLTALLERRVAKESTIPAKIRSSPNLKDEFVRLVEREVDRMWEIRDFLRVFIPRAIIDPAIGNAMNKAFISVRNEDILTRLQNTSLVPPAARRGRSTGALGRALGLLFGFVRPVLLGQDRARAKKMATTVAKLLVSSPNVLLTA